MSRSVSVRILPASPATRSTNLATLRTALRHLIIKDRRAQIQHVVR